MHSHLCGEAGIAQLVQRLATGWMAGVWFLAGERDVSLLHSIQTGSGFHPASYPVGTGGSFPGVKRPRLEADHSSSFSAEVNNGGAMTSLPHTSLWRDAY
jgi:hypothetical protein